MDKNTILDRINNDLSLATPQAKNAARNLTNRLPLDRMAKSVRNVNIYPADAEKGCIIMTFYAEQKGNEFEVWVYINQDGKFTKVQWWYNDGVVDDVYDSNTTIMNIMDFLADRWSPEVKIEEVANG